MPKHPSPTLRDEIEAIMQSTTPSRVDVVSVEHPASPNDPHWAWGIPRDVAYPLRRAFEGCPVAEVVFGTTPNGYPFVHIRAADGRTITLEAAGHVVEPVFRVETGSV